MFKKSLTILAVVSFLLIAAGARAGEEGKNPFSLRDQDKKGLSLLDPQRLSLSHSYGLYFSTGKDAKSLALYRSSIRYRLAKPLTVEMDLGYLHHPLFKRGYQQGVLLSRMGIDYRPSPYFNLQINISRNPWLDPWFRGER